MILMKRNIHYALFIAMDSCWLGALLLFLNTFLPIQSRQPIIILWIAYPLAFIVNRIINSYGIKHIKRYAINLAILAFSLFLVIKLGVHRSYMPFDFSWFTIFIDHISQPGNEFYPELLAIGGTITFFLMGLNLAKKENDFSRFSQSFQFGFTILLIVLFLSYILDKKVDNSILITVIFSILSLTGFEYLRLLKSSKTGEVRFLSGGINHYLVVIAIIVGLGSLIGLLITPDLLLIILRFFSYIGKQIAELFIFLAELFPANSISDIPVDNGIPQIPATREEPWQVWQWFRMSPDLRDTLRRIFVTLFSIGVLFSLYRMFESILQWIKRQATPDITLESLPGSSFSSIIRSILYSIYSTVHWFISWIYLHVSSHTRKDYRNDSIRHIYRNFLRWSASRGYERLVNETPFEFRTKLESMMPPQERLLLNEISEAYVIARYRPKSDIIESLNQVKIAWKKLSRYKFKRNRLSLIQNTNN